ncbi:MAG: DUF4212 domain-containing protein [Planctomycetota bacterium]
MPDPSVETIKRRYWRANVQTMVLLLGLWAFVGLGCGILWADWLNQWQLGGIPLGFWFAQQGSILVFVGIILVYAIVMNRLDTRTRKELAALADQLSPDTEPTEGDAS